MGWLGLDKILIEIRTNTYGNKANYWALFYASIVKQTHEMLIFPLVSVLSHKHLRSLCFDPSRSRHRIDTESLEL